MKSPLRIKLILLLFMLSTFQLISQDNVFNGSIDMVINNPASIYREEELIKINIQDIKSLKSDFNENAYIIYEENREIPSQIYYQNEQPKIIFNLDLDPNQHKVIQIKYLSEGHIIKKYENRTYAELAMKFDAVYDSGKFVGDSFQNFSKVIVPQIHTDHDALFKYEGPGWESELVGYRFYLDWRNATDIFGKKVNELVLHKVGVNDVIAKDDSYHEMQDWGMDILKVGQSLGIGSIAMKVGNKMNMVSKTDQVICEITANGPILSEVNTHYKGWEVDSKKYDLSAAYSITAGSRITDAKLKITGDAENITSGIAKHENTVYMESETKGEWQYIALYGLQSLAGDNLGLVLFYPESKLLEKGEDELNYYVMLKPENNIVNYKFAAAWEQEFEGIKSKDEFVKYIDDELEKLNNPVIIESK